MDDTDATADARAPEPEDLVRICRALNEADARYVLIGGFAVIAHGASRFTKDIDLLVDDAPDNALEQIESLVPVRSHSPRCQHAREILKHVDHHRDRRCGDLLARHGQEQPCARRIEQDRAVHERCWGRE